MKYILIEKKCIDVYDFHNCCSIVVEKVLNTLIWQSFDRVVKSRKLIDKITKNH